MFQAFFHQSFAELSLQLGGAAVIIVPLLWAVLRNRPETMNSQIDALARKTRARDAA